MSEDISKNNKRIAKNTLYLYLRMILTMVVSLYTVRIVLSVLSITDYGIYGAVGGVVASLGFITSTLACASQRFFSYEIGKGDGSKINDVFSSLFILYLFASIIVFLLGELLGIWFMQNKMLIPDDRADASLWVFHCALASFILSLIINPYQALIIAKEKMSLYAYISILDVVLKLSIVYFLLVVDFDKLKVYALLLFFSSIITNSIYFFYCFIKYKETHLIFKFDIALIKSILGYSTWTLLGTLAGMCNSQGLNVILNVFFGPVANGAYLIAAQVSSQSSLFANNFYTAIRPAIIKCYSAGEYKVVNKYCLFSTKCIFALMSIIILPLFINTKELLALWLGEVAPYMVTFVRLSLIYALILSLSNPITTVVQAQGNVKLYHGLVDGLGLFALPITFILFKIGLDAYWGYLSMIIVFSLCHILRIYVIKTVFPVFDSYQYLRIIIPMIITSALSYIIMKQVIVFFESTLIGILFSSLTAAIIVSIITFVIVFSKQERILLARLAIDKYKGKTM